MKPGVKDFKNFGVGVSTGNDAVIHIGPRSLREDEVLDLIDWLRDYYRWRAEAAEKKDAARRELLEVAEQVGRTRYYQGAEDSPQRRLYRAAKKAADLGALDDVGGAG